jgi:hypothetical protein
MACVHAATAKTKSTTKSLITLSSSVKSAKGRKAPTPCPSLGKNRNGVGPMPVTDHTPTYSALFVFLIIITGSDVREHAD